MPRNKIYDSAAHAIGDTPMIQINRLVPPEHATVLAKCEFFQPLNSVKDRIGTAMIEAGERDGKVSLASCSPHMRRVISSKKIDNFLPFEDAGTGERQAG